MKLTIVVNPTDHAKLTTARAVAAGCAAHGDGAEIVDSNQKVGDSDNVCCWGWGQGLRHLQLGRNVLIMELAYLADRQNWISLGWNGLNGRAIFPCVDAGDARWRRHFAHLLRPWRMNHDGYALVLGQMPGDKAVRMVNFERWAREITTELERQRYDVRFRPHPRAPEVVAPAPLALGTLEDALAGAAFAVTWNSNSGVDAVLAGVPTVTMDEGAMAWDVTSHDICMPIATPDRKVWASRMAYAQWLPKEIERGEAWEYLRHLI